MGGLGLRIGAVYRVLIKNTVCNSRSTVASTVWGRMRLWVDGGTPLRGPDGGERLSLAALHAITP